MKKTVLLSFSALIGSALSAQTILINESFDTYSPGVLVSVVNPTSFAIWPGASDQVVSNAQAHSGNNSMGCIATVVAGGPGDLLLKLGDKVTGFYTLSWWMYVPSGKGGYFNIQHNEDATPTSFAAEVYFLDGGIATCKADNITDSVAYSQDTWFQVNLIFDLSNTTASLLVNSTYVASWPFNTVTTGAVGPNQLGAIDFYSAGGTGTFGEYYVDDVVYMQLPVGIEETASADLLTFPNPAGDQLFVDLPGSAVNPTAQLCDATGRMVVSSNAYSNVGEALRMELDLRNVPNGVYTLQVNTGGVILTRKIVKS